MLHGGEAKDGPSRKSFSIGQITPGLTYGPPMQNHPQSPCPISNRMLLLLQLQHGMFPSSARPRKLGIDGMLVRSCRSPPFMGMTIMLERREPDGYSMLAKVSV